MHTFSETGAGVPAFLAKLWRLVEDNETNDLISWSTDGRSFTIQNQAQFAKELLPLNYKHNNMASFIRQLNMYGFHKITSIDNGGLRFDKDEMEFTHPCFQKDHPYLLEHIKRKIANPKQPEEKSGYKLEAVNRVLTEVKNMRGRQDTLDSRFSTMKQENEALWREIAILRQKHLKQQQIVNKLIQFLVTIVQPARTGLTTMNNNPNKRRFQLMINDAPQSSKVRLQQILHNIMVKKTSGNEGAVIQELGEVLEEVAYENNQDLNPEVPEVHSPESVTQKSPYRPTTYQSEYIEEIINPAQMDYVITNVKQEQSEKNSTNDLIDYIEEGGTFSEDDAYLVDLADEIDTNDIQLYDAEERLNTPMVIKEMGKQQPQVKVNNQPQIAQSILKPTATGRKNNNMNKNQKSLLHNKNNRKIAVARKPQVKPVTPLNISTAQDNNMTSLETPNIIMSSNNNAQVNNEPANGKIISNTLYNAEDFICDEMPNDLFEDNNLIANEKESPMLGGFNFQGGCYNPNFDINEVKNKQQNAADETAKNAASTSKDMALKRVVSNDYDVMRFNTPEDYGNHLETVQTDLETLKDLLRGEGYTLDANALLGHPGANTPSISRVYLPSSAFDQESVSKLFGGNEDVLGYDFPMNTDLLNDKKAEGSSASTSGSQLMEYKRNERDLLDLNELLDDNSSIIM